MKHSSKTTTLGTVYTLGLTDKQLFAHQVLSIVSPLLKFSPLLLLGWGAVVALGKVSAWIN